MLWAQHRAFRGAVIDSTTGAGNVGESLIPSHLALSTKTQKVPDSKHPNTEILEVLIITLMMAFGTLCHDIEVITSRSCNGPWLYGRIQGRGLSKKIMMDPVISSYMAFQVHSKAAAAQGKEKVRTQATLQAFMRRSLGKSAFKDLEESQLPLSVLISHPNPPNDASFDYPNRDSADRYERQSRLQPQGPKHPNMKMYRDSILGIATLALYEEFRLQTSHAVPPSVGTYLMGPWASQRG